MAVVPMRAKDRPLGVLLVASRRSHQLGPPDVELLTAIGNTVGVALENALLHGELREKEEVRTQLLSRVISAQEEERKRIARELHDESAQLLATLLVEIGAAEEILPVTAKRARDILGRAKADATRALTEMRQMILDLRPSALDDLGLVAAVQWYAKMRLEQSGTRMRLKVDGSQRRLPAAVETALFRIAQEAINNVAKHARASNVSIRLEFTKASVTVVVKDDGQGFDIKVVAESKDKTQGLGLLGMRERAALLGGRATIESRPGRGTRVAVEIPLDEDDGRR
jgi:signal transduction histidine kinase